MNSMTNKQAAKLKKNDRVTLAILPTEHGSLNAGDVVYVHSVTKTNPIKVYVARSKDRVMSGLHDGWVYATSLKGLCVTKEDIELEIEESYKEIDVIKERITSLADQLSFLKVNKLKEFDEDEFKAYQVLKTLKLGSIKEAREITRILKS